MESDVTAEATLVELDRRPEVRFLLGLLVVSCVVFGICVRIMQAGVSFWGFVAGVGSVGATLGGLLAVWGLTQSRRRLYLVIDAAGVRKERTGSTPEWLVHWPDVASVWVRRGDRQAGSSLMIEPGTPQAAQQHRRIGAPHRVGEMIVRRVQLGRTDPAALEAALRRWTPPGGARSAPPPVPVVPPPTGPPTRIDLTARNRTSRVLLIVGGVLTVLLVLGLLATLVAGPEGIGLRLVAGGVAIAIILLVVGVRWGGHRRPGGLIMDHEHLVVVDLRERIITRVAWTDLAGVGVMTNEAARRRQLFSAALSQFPWLGRRMVRVPMWLELFPAGPDAHRRHPELRTAGVLGRPRREGQEQRWLIGIGDGLGQALPVEEHVRHWRPDLWRGHRAGSFLFG